MLCISRNLMTLKICVYIYIFDLEKQVHSQGVKNGLLITHSVASAKDPWFNSPFARAFCDLIFGPLHWQASSIWLCTVRLQQTVTA